MGKESPLRDFSSGPVVKDLPSTTGNMGSIPGRETKIPHAMGQLSLRAATTEPVHSGARTPKLERSPRSAREEPAYRNEDLTCCN